MGKCCCVPLRYEALEIEHIPSADTKSGRRRDKGWLSAKRSFHVPHLRSRPLQAAPYHRIIIST